jgi:hypothetical protein
VNHYSLPSVVNRWGVLSSALVVRSWSVVSPHSHAALVIAAPGQVRVSSVLPEIWPIHPSVER